MSALLLTLILLSVGAVAWAVAGGVLRYAERLRLVQAPNHRSSHVRPTPHGGGLGMVVAASLAGMGVSISSGWTLGWIVLALGLLVAAAGLWDDIRPLSARVRLAVQATACGGLLAAVGELPSVFPLFPIDTGWLLSALVLVGGVWWINLFNFMDGIDGIAASQAVFMLTMGPLLGLWRVSGVESDPSWVWALCVAAAAAGFLVRNWPPAKIFMGDAGSTWLAFMIFALGLVSVLAGWLNYTVWLILGAVFVTDTMVTLLTRMLHGERWHEAHRSHAYQRLARRWGGHRSVALLVTAINLLWLSPLAVGCLIWSSWAPAIMAAAYTPLTAGVILLGAGRRDNA